MGSQSDEFLNGISEKSHVLLLGGLAVIAHGLSRTTEDADIWLDSMQPLEDWLAVLDEGLPEGGYYWDLLRKERVAREDLEEVVREIGVLRIGGLDRYINVFRKPNELEETDFATAWAMSVPHIGKFRLLDETFLIITKENTGRERDRIDIGFLETKLRSRFASRLSVCNAEEALSLFHRYLDHATCEAAMENPDPAVREMGLAGLRELAADGNPFAIEVLKKRE